MRAFIVIATLLACSRLTEAQATGWPNTRRGFWIGFGMGDGSARIDCTFFCDSGRRDAVSGVIGSGFTLSPHVLVGGEATGWLSRSISRNGIWTASAVVLWYPSRTGASYLKLGIGWLSYRAYPEVADATGLLADAPSATLGAGYEVRVGPRVSLVPWINVVASTRVTLDYRLGFSEPPPLPPTVRFNVVQAGLGVTRH